MGESSSVEPPFEATYKNLFRDAQVLNQAVEEERELPLIDLSELNRGEFIREECKRKMARASREWGFFQVVNHGVSREILETMRSEQVKLFRKPFQEKMKDRNLNFSTGSYRWGAPSATCLRQLSWSEAFHVPLSDISGGSVSRPNNLRYVLSFITILCLPNSCTTFVRLKPYFPVLDLALSATTRDLTLIPLIRASAYNSRQKL